MKLSKNVKIVVFVPGSSAEKVRKAAGEAGAGKIGNYTDCSFSARGIGRFRPNKRANPAIGKVGKLEAVREERIEFVCSRSILRKVISAVRKVHPYQEVALDVYPLEEI